MMRNVILLLVVIATSSAAGEYQLSVRPRGSRFTKPLGTSIVLTCELESTTGGARVTSLQWLDGRRSAITESPGRVYVEKDGETVRKLYITSIRNRDAGSYICSGVVARQRLEKNITMMLFKDITFDHAPSPQHPAIYTDCLVECIVSGQPVPVVSWRYRGRKVFSRGRLDVKPRGLLIRNVTEADNGDYTCRAEVEAEGRYDERKITLAVHIPPVMLSETSDVEGVVGKPVTMSCRASGTPAPKYEFHKVGGVKLVNSEDVDVDTYGGEVSFHAVKKSDEGRYACDAINDVGSAAGLIQLRVLVPSQIYQFTNLTQLEGTSAVLTCLAHGDPAPNMTLYRVSRRGQLHRIHVHRHGSELGRLQLVIDNVSPDDASTFVCRASNVAGDSEATATVVVNYKPRFSIHQSRLVYAWVGRTVNISCRVQGHPPPTVDWLHNNMILASNRTFHLYESASSHYSLEIRVGADDDSWIYGNYVCRASNFVGSSSTVIHLKRATVPDKPRGVVVNASTPNTVRLQVLPPGEFNGLAVRGYRVKYEDRVYDFDTDQEIKLENLRPSTRYILHIGAKNDVGVGTLIEFSITTDNVREPYPIHINSPYHADRANEYLMTWRKPETGGRRITKYDIGYRQVQHTGQAIGNWVNRSVVDNSRQPILEYLIQGLSSSTFYQVEVLANNEMGKSQPAAGKPFIFLTAEGGDEPDLAPVQTTVSMTTVVAVAIAMLVALLIVIDVSCYFINACGLTMCVCVHLCGHESGATVAKPTSDKDVDDSERKEMLKASSSSPTVDTDKPGEDQTTAETDEHQTRDDVDNELSFEEEQRLKNRRSILSQGDERWKDVVQELEKELGMKKALHEDDENDMSASVLPSDVTSSHHS